MYLTKISSISYTFVSGFIIYSKSERSHSASIFTNILKYSSAEVKVNKLGGVFLHDLAEASFLSLFKNSENFARSPLY
jgi:hypothetical protein